MFFLKKNKLKAIFYLYKEINEVRYQTIDCGREAARPGYAGAAQLGGSGGAVPHGRARAACAAAAFAP